MPIVLLGLIVWLPALYLNDLVRGSWFSRNELIAASGPVLALLVPGALQFERGGKILAGLAIAAAPILLIFGALVASFVQRVIFGNTYSPSSSTWVPLICVALWAIPGALVYLNLGANQPKKADVEDT